MPAAKAPNKPPTVFDGGVSDKKDAPRRFGVRMQPLAFGGTVTHQLEVRIHRPRWWPPFFSMTVFRPRLRVEFTNAGDDLPGFEVRLEIAKHQDVIWSPSTNIKGWRFAWQSELKTPWKTGDALSRSIHVQPTLLPTSGTYVFRLLCIRDEPTPGQGGNQQGLTVVPLQIDESQVVADYLINEFFRVEPMSSVLALGLIAATMMIAVATLVVALV